MAAAATLSYLPTAQDTARFWEEENQRASDSINTFSVPSGWPTKLESPLAWTRAEAEKQRGSWSLDLSSQDVAAVDKALSDFEASSLDMSDISPETFKLPASLGALLREVSNQCYHGIGFKVVRGLDPDKYSPKQNAIVFAGIGAHIGSQRGFIDGDLQERVLSHVVNVAGEAEGNDIKAAPGFTKGSLSFHTDNCEIMAQYCVRAASEGGRSLLSSSWQVYNQLAAARPEVLQTLSETWVLDTFKDYKTWAPRVSQMLEPVNDNNVLLRFSRYPITGFAKQRDSSLPKPTTAQLEAIDAVHFFAASNSIGVDLAKGDIIFVNDMAVMHAREAFSEGGVRHQRHLAKMFFHDPSQHWPVAAFAQDSWRKMYGANRSDGGRDEMWEIEYFDGQEINSTVNG